MPATISTRAPFLPFSATSSADSLGGPLVKNKVMLFGNYEGFRQAWGLSALTLVPDNLARQGYLPDANGNEQYVGVDPAVQPLLALWPEQNGAEIGGGIAEAFSNPKQHIREDFGTTRLDYNIGDKDLLFGVYTIDDSAADTPSQNPLSRIDESLRAQVASVQEQHSFSQSLLNTARFGFSRANFFFTGYPTVDLPGWVSDKPIGAIVISGSTASNGASAITGAGANVGSNNSDARNLIHVWTTTSTGHTASTRWKSAAGCSEFNRTALLAQYQYGQASFSTLQSFLQGSVKTFTVVPTPTKLGWRLFEGAGFVEDVIKVAPRFELRAGFRSESTNGWNEAHGRAANYDFVDGVIQTDPFSGTSALKKNNAKFLP